MTARELIEVLRSATQEEKNEIQELLGLRSKPLVFSESKLQGLQDRLRSKEKVSITESKPTYIPDPESPPNAPSKVWS